MLILCSFRDWQIESVLSGAGVGVTAASLLGHFQHLQSLGAKPACHDAKGYLSAITAYPPLAVEDFR